MGLLHIRMEDEAILQLRFLASKKGSGHSGGVSKYARDLLMLHLRNQESTTYFRRAQEELHRSAFPKREEKEEDPWSRGYETTPGGDSIPKHKESDVPWDSFDP